MNMVVASNNLAFILYEDGVSENSPSRTAYNPMKLYYDVSNHLLELKHAKYKSNKERDA
jgi:hypothetical protein